MMRLFVIIFCGLMSVNTLAQSSDTIRKDTSKRVMVVDARSVNKHDKPLYIVDGITYKANIRKINPNSIISIIILKDKEAISKYGPKATNGVIIITTKKNKNIDTIADVKSLDSVVDKDALYVVDGVISQNKLNGVDPQNILSIKILKKLGCDSCYINLGDHGAVIIVTKQAAVRAYQKKFSIFSTKYRDYLEHHQNNEESISYIVNGLFFSLKPAARTKYLYEITTNKIKAVEFIENQFYNGGDSRPYIVIITTKK